MGEYYKIKPDLSTDQVAYIDDWEFTFWPNTPKSEIIQNPDGTFSVKMEKDFVPLVNQLQQLFENDAAPESGTYLGEAVLIGALEPADIISGDFINSPQGIVVSARLLEIFRQHFLPEHFMYELPLIRTGKHCATYTYLYFKQTANDADYDVRLIHEQYCPVVCVSKKLKEAISEAGMKGCVFKLLAAGPLGHSEV